MASTLEQQPQTGSQKYVDFDEFIEYQVNRTRSGIKHTDLLTAGVTVALAVTAYLLAFVVLDHWVVPGGFSYLPRALMLGALLAFVVGWTGWKIVYPYLRRITALYAAREIEGTAPGLKSSLLTLVDLKRAGRPVPAHIVAALEKRAAVNLSQMDVEQAVDRRPLMRLTYALFAVVVAMCLYTVFSPKSIASSLWRALAPAAQTAVATRTRIEKVDPGDATVLARSQLEVTVDVSGEVPKEATLRFTTSDRSFVDEPVAMRETGEGLKRFRGMLTGPNGRGLLQDFTYFIEAGDARSPEYRVTVEQAPYATVEEVVYDYPDYMGLDTRTQAGGEIDTWEGVTVTIRAVTNMPVKSGAIHFTDSEDTSVKAEEMPLSVTDGTRLEATWKVEFRSDGTYPHFYRIQVRTAEGQVDPVPRLYTLKLRRDLPPELKLLHPSGDIEMPANGVLPIAYQASDPDFLLSSVRTSFENNNLKLDAHTRRLYEAPPWQSQVAGTDQIDLAPFGLEPGDVLTFWLEAVDNMEPLGSRLGNRTVTPKLNITIVEPVAQEQVEQQRDEQQQEAAQRLEEAQQQPQQQPGEETGAEPAGAEDRPPASDAAETDPAEAQPQQQGDQPPQANDDQRNPQPGEQKQPGEQGTRGEQGTEPSAQPMPGERGGEQQQPDAEGQPKGMPEDGAEGGTQSQPQPGGHQQRPGNQPGQTGDRAQPQQRPSDDGGRASDDQALRELFDKYKEEIEQQRREGAQPDQQQPGDSDANQQPSPDSDSQPQRSPGEESQSDQRGPSDAQRSPGDTRSPGREPKTGDRSPAGQQATDKPAGDQTGDSPGPTSPDNRTKPGEQPQPGEGTGTPMPQEAPEGAEPMPGEGDPSAEGQRRPATDDAKPNGSQRTADPNGERRPGADPNANPAQSAEQPEGQPDGDPATRPGEKPAGSDAARKPGEPGGARNPREAEPAPDSQPGEEPMPGDRGDSGTDPMQTDRPPSKTGEQPEGPDMSDPGEGREGGQRSDQPAGGEQGSSQQASEGTKGGTQEGPGDATSKPGAQSDSQGKSGGKPGDQPGEGSTSKPGGQDPDGQKPGGADGMSSDSEGEAGGEKPMGDSPAGDQQGKGEQGAKEGGGQEAGGKEGGGKEGGGKEGGGKEGGGKEGGGKEGGGKEGGGKEGGGKEGGGKEGGGKEGGGQDGGGEQSGGDSAGDQSSQGTSRNGSQSASSAARSGTGGGQDGQAPPEGAGGGGAGGDLTPEAAELADKRRASELVLKRLEDDLQRGEVSEDFLKELGWSEDNLRDFMQRLQQRLSDSGEDQSPEAQARRNQFQEILRGIDYSSQGGTRAAGEGARGASQGFGGARRPAPAEFRRDQEAFKNRLSREAKPQK